ncbi:MAG: FkbM family methyltransferase [Bacteroidetes bacterium]|nr:FkbM family methyltransferase [Bacteroidota bacterium]
MSSIKDIIRNWQTFFPFLHDLRFDLQFAWRKIKGQTHDSDFELLSQISVPLGMDLLDVGANRGEALQSLLMALKTDNNQFYSFEPNEIIFQKLKSRYGKHVGVNLRNYGLGHEKGSFQLYIPFYRKWMFDGLASFIKEEVESWLPTFIWNFKPENHYLKETICQIETLDSQKLNPFFIKLDVQGFEQQVLDGGKKTLEVSKPILLIESIKHETEEFLSVMGYQFFHYQNRKLHLGNGLLNTYCIPQNRINDLMHLFSESPII